MYIEYLKLRNYIGILKGTGLNEIEIDFKSKKRNKIVMLVGRNGSGKSVIMNSLTPFSGSFDTRKNLIIPDEEGYKELIISHNESRYVIKHHYTKGGIKSYFSKDGEELNKNGLVRSFESLVESELGFNSEYLRVGRIGSVMNNFIDLKTAERKKYITNLLPNVDEFLEAFKNVHKRFSSIKSKLNYVVENINKIPEEKTINKNISIINNTILDVEESLEKLQSEINKNHGRIDGIKSEIEEKNLNVEEEYLTAKTENSDSKHKISEFLTKFPNLKKYKNLKEVKSKIVELEENLDVVKKDLFKMSTNVENVKTEILKHKNFISSKKEKINNISNEDEESLKNLLTEQEDVLKTYEESISEDEEFNFSQDEFDSLINLKNSFQVITNDIKILLGEFSTEQIEKYLDKNLTKESIKEKISKCEIHIEENQNRVKTTKAAIDIIHERKKLLDTLKKRPENCKIDNCAFISKSLKYKDFDFEKELNDRTQILNGIDEDTKKYQGLIEKYKEFYKLDSEINRIYLRLMNSVSNPEILKKIPTQKYFKSVDGFKKIFDGLNMRKIETTFNIDELVKVLSNMNDIEHVKKDISNIKDKLKYISEAGSLIKDLNDELKSTNEQLLEKTGSLTKLNEELSILSESERKLERSIRILKEFKRLKKIKKKSSTLLKENESKFSKYQTKLGRIKIYTEENESILKELSTLKERLSPLKEDLSAENLKLSKLVEYQDSKDLLEKDYEKIAIIDEALNPTKGIPLFFIEGYLNETRRIANELLNIAFDGKFFINKLNINESDFKIPIITDSPPEKEDIIECSQGEIALTKLSLSLALIEQSKTKYNIIFLDEIDSTLDTDNRRHFIDILEKQIERMNIDQLFIISHNNYFDSSNVDLILLDGNNINTSDKSFMNGKNVLFKI